MVIQPISGWIGTGTQYPDSHPRAFSKFKFCWCFFRKKIWWSTRKYEHLFHNVSLKLFSTRNFVWVLFSFSTINTGDSKILFHFLSWRQNVLWKQWWFTFLVDSTQRWGPGTFSAFSSRAEAGTSARGQQPHYCRLQRENYFPRLIKEKFCALTTTGL